MTLTIRRKKTATITEAILYNASVYKLHITYQIIPYYIIYHTYYYNLYIT